MKKYFIELKNRAFFIFFNSIVNLSVIYFYKEIVLFLIVQSNNTDLSFFYFIFTDVTEILQIYFKMLIFLNFQIFILTLIYHIFLFLSPALFQFEYIYCRIAIKIFYCCWCFITIIAHNFLIPFTWNFFLSFQNLITKNSFTIHFEAKLSEYFVFYTSLYYLFLFYCCYFLLLFFSLNFISSKTISGIKKFRKLYYFSFVFFSTLISPPDILSQLVISFMLILIYEILIFSILLKNNYNSKFNSVTN